MSFPGATPSYAGFTAGHTLAVDTHAAQSNAEQADIIALSNKVGTGASTPTSGLLLRGNGVGTSAWGQVVLTSDVSGVLPVANGGTGIASLGAGVATFLGTPNSANLATALTDETGSGALVFGTSPTIVTPTIASFTNANHNHQSSAGGGTLSAAAITSLDLTSTTLKNPYKFYVYRNAAQNTGNNAFAVLQCDTTVFDTGSNVDIVTNKGRFTAPVAGFYYFNAAWQTAALSGSFGGGISLFKNGLRILDGQYLDTTSYTNAIGSSFTVSGLLQLAAGDYVEAQPFASVTVAITVGVTYASYFQGYLVSTT